MSAHLSLIVLWPTLEQALSRAMFQFPIEVACGPGRVGPGIERPLETT
jgi:hypothetical protein